LDTSVDRARRIKSASPDAEEAVLSPAASFESTPENEATAVAAMVPTQTTNIQWRTSNGESARYPSIPADDEGSIDRKTIYRRIEWTVDDDKALKDAIEKHNGNGRKKWGQLPHWFLIEQKSSVGIDGTVSWGRRFV
jgi:hypothetical protein